MISILRYITWTEKQALASTIKVDRSSVLERCIRQFHAFPQYKDDPRYLKICLMYADCRSDPREVFSFLETSGIGQKNPLTYVAWAFVLETLGQFEEAHAVFGKGQARVSDGSGQAELTKKQEQFRARVAEKLQRQASGEPVDVTDHGIAPTLGQQGPRQRRALGEMPVTKKGKVRHDRAIRTKESGALGTVAAAGPTNGNNAGAFQIFADDDSGKHLSSSTGTAAIHDLPTDKIIAKENTRTAGNWNGGVGTKAKATKPIEFQVFKESTDSPVTAPAPEANARRAFEQRPALANYVAPPKTVLLQVS